MGLGRMCQHILGQQAVVLARCAAYDVLVEVAEGGTLFLGGSEQSVADGLLTLPGHTLTRGVVLISREVGGVDVNSLDAANQVLSGLALVELETSETDL